MFLTIVKQSTILSNSHSSYLWKGKEFKTRFSLNYETVAWQILEIYDLYCYTCCSWNLTLVKDAVTLIFINVVIIVSLNLFCCLDYILVLHISECIHSRKNFALVSIGGRYVAGHKRLCIYCAPLSKCGPVYSYQRNPRANFDHVYRMVWQTRNYNGNKTRESNARRGSAGWRHANQMSCRRRTIGRGHAKTRRALKITLLITPAFTSGTSSIPLFPHSFMFNMNNVRLKYDV